MDEQKEIFRLWREYLMRSDSYKTFCYKWGEQISNAEVAFLNEWIGHGGKRNKKARFQMPEKIKDHPMTPTLQVFSNPHNIDFDTWWPVLRYHLSAREKSKRGAVEDCSVDFSSTERDIDSCIKAFIKVAGREPSALELKTTYMDMLKNKPKMRMAFKVDITYSLTEIKDSFKEIMTSDVPKKMLAIGKRLRELTVNFKPTGKLRLNELQDYLDAYDMWKAKVHNRKSGDPGGWNAIIQHFEPGSQERTADQCVKSFKRKHSKKPGVLELQEMLDEERKRYASLERKYKRYKEKAAKIISNVERGYFPGEY